MPEIHSTGRGGAGNIGPDPVVYTDGSIVREGPAGKAAGAGEFSTGRGGAGNIEPGEAGAASRADGDVIPEPAMRESHQDVFHTGRGGQGNVHKDKYGGHSKPQTAEHMARFHADDKPAEGADAAAGKKHQSSMGDKVKHLFDKKH